MTIETMKADLKVLEDQIEVLSRKRSELRQKIADAKASFAVGARITYEGAKCVWEIVAIQPGYAGDSEPKYVGAKVKKDGTPGALKSGIYVPCGKTLIAAS